MSEATSILGDAILDIQDGDRTYRLIRVMTRSGPQTLEVPIEYTLPLDEGYPASDADDPTSGLSLVDFIGAYADGPDYDDYEEFAA